jgi:hypothetical protein
MKCRTHFKTLIRNKRIRKITLKTDRGLVYHHHRPRWRDCLFLIFFCFLLLSVFVSDDEWLKGSNFFYGHFKPESRKFRNKDETKKAYRIFSERKFISIDNT